MTDPISTWLTLKQGGLSSSSLGYFSPRPKKHETFTTHLEFDSNPIVHWLRPKENAAVMEAFDPKRATKAATPAAALSFARDKLNAEFDRMSRLLAIKNARISVLRNELVIAAPVIYNTSTVKYDNY